ncbi:MAG TPA: hypothetical protein VGV87_04145, partial [Blastocatellia bacterium]|nr:hypothetical protein [Blastocatellia bacterium]
MRSLKNNLLAGSVVVLLLASCVLSVPRATPGKSIGQPKSVASVQPSSISQDVADRSDDLSIDASFGDVNISLERKKHRGKSCCLVVIQIIAVLVGKPGGDGGSPMIDLRATITGADAVRGSLLYGLAWLAGDPNPIGRVRALGYDIDVSKEHDRPCTDGPRSPMCAEGARRLATLLDATLALGSAEELAQFRRDASAIGVAPDCVPRNAQAASPVLSAASPDSLADISMDASLGDEEISFERKIHCSVCGAHGVHIKLAVLHVRKPGDGEGPPLIDLRATVDGPDSVGGSLLYALGWVAGHSDPLGAVRALGYDIAVPNAHTHSCSDQLPGHTCEDAAQRLATLIDSTLGLGDPGERAQFRRDASAIGIAPSCSTR